jgi:hypothetical protein
MRSLAMPVPGSVLWRRLTMNDFNAMNGTASPRGRGGGARHVALGVSTETFPIEELNGTASPWGTAASPEGRW